ncbi:hypothetical protein LINPERHAP2_LOCUS32281 [Linum perenne]
MAPSLLIQRVLGKRLLSFISNCWALLTVIS